MQRLILVRHGTLEMPERCLDEKGKEQMRMMGEWLRDQPGGLGSVMLFASPTLRGFQSAAIISAILGIPVNARRELEDGEIAIEAVSRLVEDNHDSDTVILVGHDELAADFPYPFGRRFLQRDGFPRKSIPRGAAWLIDCRSKTCAEITPRC
jgi:phosphohistidine phosphatase SixA